MKKLLTILLLSAILISQSLSAQRFTQFYCNILFTCFADSLPPTYPNGSNGGMTRVVMPGSNSAEIKSDSTIGGIGGQVLMQVPKELGFHTHMEFFEAGDNKKRIASWFGNNTAKLLPGLYDITVDGKYTIKNVPVELGKQTRLKMGVLRVSGYGSFELENSNHQKISYAPPFSIILPEGKYYIVGKKKFQIEIKDGELTEL